MSTLNYIDENGNINKAGVIPKNYPSTNISYDNSQSGLSSIKVQGAIDELAGRDLSFSTIVSPIQVLPNTNVTFTLNSGNFIDYKALAVALYDGTYVRANTLLTRNPFSISFDGIITGLYAGNTFVATLKQSSDNTGVINHNCPADLNMVIRAFK